ncbi:hypothetical protein CU097_004569, partial [Rhizopus azygosporus]
VSNEDIFGSEKIKAMIAVKNKLDTGDIGNNRRAVMGDRRRHEITGARSIKSAIQNRLARDVHISMKNDGFDAKNTCTSLDDDIKNIKQKKADGMFKDVSKKRSSKNDPNTNTQLGDLDDLYGENDPEHNFDDDSIHFFPSTSSQRSMMINYINSHRDLRISLKNR